MKEKLIKNGRSLGGLILAVVIFIAFETMCDIAPKHLAYILMILFAIVLIAYMNLLDKQNKEEKANNFMADDEAILKAKEIYVLWDYTDYSKFMNMCIDNTIDDRYIIVLDKDGHVCYDDSHIIFADENKLFPLSVYQYIFNYNEPENSK